MAIVPPRTLNGLSDSLVFRMTRLGGNRAWYFLPHAVIKVARGHHAELLHREIEAARMASRHPFWQALVVRPRPLFARVSVARRYWRVTAHDHGAIAALAEALAVRALEAERKPLLAFFARQPLFYRLSRAEQGRLIEHGLAGTLPATAMHGDFHMFNFCKTRAGDFCLLDWEHFDPESSFALDYVEFHTAMRSAHYRSWLDFFDDCDEPDPSVMRAASLYGVEPAALWALYVLNRMQVICDRKGGFGRLNPDVRARMLALVRRSVAEAAATAA